MSSIGVQDQGLRIFIRVLSFKLQRLGFRDLTLALNPRALGFKGS